MKYEIYEGNMERLQKKLNRIFNKCKKYGNEFSFEEVGEVFKKQKDDNGKEHMLRYVVVDVEGTAKVNDWEFAAKIEHTEKGNVVTGYGIEIPNRFYNCSPWCEHCKTDRWRKDTYIVRNVKTNEFKQVGRNCLADYTGGLSANQITNYISTFDELMQFESPVGGFGLSSSYYDKYTMLLYGAEAVRCFGYKKKNYDDNEEPVYSTSSMTYDFWYVDHNPPIGYEGEKFHREIRRMMENAGVDVNRQETKEFVDAALKWISEQSSENTYINNLKVVSALDYVKHKNIGILVSLIPTYNRATEKKLEREKKLENEKSISNYVGEVGQRVKINIVSNKVVTSWETDYGVVSIYKLVDENGNVFTWKTSKYINKGEDEKFTLVGTVKEHKEFRDVKQTELTRCKV